MLYLPPGTAAELLSAVNVPAVITEGEFKTLALSRLASHQTERQSFLAVGLQGVWNFRGVVGKSNDAQGVRVDVHGPIPDLDRMAWQGRRVLVFYDFDVTRNLGIAEARRLLTLELEGRGAEILWVQWPKDTREEEKGADDLLASRGPEFVLALLAKARPVCLKKKAGISVVRPAPDDWRSLLTTGSDHEPRATLANAITALRMAPEFDGAFAFDEFRSCTVTVGPTPWESEPHAWRDLEDIRTAEWLQRQGINVSREIAGQAVEVVALDRKIHPIRQYLRSIAWDEVRRVDTWLTTHLGAMGNPEGGIKYLEAVGSRFLISLVARVELPGCKADCAPVFEGPQGSRKSTAVRTLAGEWFADDIADFGSKDSALQVRGVWLFELPELDALNRSDTGRVKAFMSRGTDHFRPPYGRRVVDLPRQCIFCATVNRSDYLLDETGNRRFWPVRCGSIDIDALVRDRDQLFAEAFARYQAGEVWWLEGSDLVRRAQAEQAARYEGDSWDGPVLEWANDRITGGRLSVSVAEALQYCLLKPRATWIKADSMRIGRIFRAAGWERYRDRREGMEWRYRPAESGTFPPETVDSGNTKQVGTDVPTKVA
jgi:predicted P-loop ATPase